MLEGFTTKSTLVTMNAVGVGDGVGTGVDVALAVGVEPDPLPPFPPHAAKLKIARHMKRMPRNERCTMFFRLGCLNIIFLLRTVQELCPLEGKGVIPICCQKRCCNSEIDVGTFLSRENNLVALINL
jgi:hypothetical protein